MSPRNHQHRQRSPLGQQTPEVEQLLSKPPVQDSTSAFAQMLMGSSEMGASRNRRIDEVLASAQQTVATSGELNLTQHAGEIPVSTNQGAGNTFPEQPHNTRSSISATEIAPAFPATNGASQTEVTNPFARALGNTKGAGQATNLAEYKQGLDALGVNSSGYGEGDTLPTQQDLEGAAIRPKQLSVEEARAQQLQEQQQVAKQREEKDKQEIQFLLQRLQTEYQQKAHAVTHEERVALYREQQQFTYKQQRSPLERLVQGGVYTVANLRRTLTRAMLKPTKSANWSSMIRGKQSRGPVGPTGGKKGRKAATALHENLRAGSETAATNSGQ